MVAHFLRLVGQVVRVHANAVPAHQAGAERQEVPLGAGGFEHFERVDAELVEQDRQVVDQRDVEVALGVLDHLGGLGDLDAAGLVGACGDDARVQAVDEVGGGGGRAGGDFEDAGDAVGLVAGVDALGAVAAVEGGVRRPGFGGIGTGARAGGERQTGDSFQDRDADFLGAAGVDGGFVDHHVAGLEDAADRLAGPDQRGQVGAFGGVDRGGHGDDVDVAVGQVGEARGAAQARRARQFLGFDFQGAVAPLAQFGHPRVIGVVANRVVLPAEFHRQRQPDVPQPDDRDTCGIKRPVRFHAVIPVGQAQTLTLAGVGRHSAVGP